MDPAFIYFTSFFAIVVVSALLSHTFIRNFFVATGTGAVAGTTLMVALASLWRGFMPHWIGIAAMLAVSIIVALGVGIPFHRSRTGRGLGQH